MKKLVLIDALAGSASYYLPLAAALGPERVVFYYDRDSLPKNQGAIKRLKEINIPCLADNRKYSEARKHEFFLADSFFKDTALAREMTGENKRFICYMHSLDGAETSHSLSPNDFLLCPHEESLYKSVGAGRFLCSEDGRVELGRASSGYEAVSIGPFHISEADLAMRKGDKLPMREELARKMRVKFKDGLPLICYFVTNGNESVSVDKGLERLSQHANIIIKTLGNTRQDAFTEYSNAAGGHIFHTPDSSLNWLMRVASDLVLVDPHGGSFITMVMTGLRHTPVHTSRYKSVSPPIPVNFTHFYHNLHVINVRLAHHISPIHIEATEMLLERLHDMDYWKRFDEQIEVVQQSALGRYWLGDEAVSRAGIFILRALERGSFTPSRSEMGITKVTPGPLGLGMNMAVTL